MHQQRPDCLYAVSTPDKTRRTQRSAVLPHGRAALVMVEPTRRGIMDTAHVPHQVGSPEHGLVAGANESVIPARPATVSMRSHGEAERETQDGIREDVVEVERAAMGGEHERVGVRLRPHRHEVWNSCGLVNHQRFIHSASGERPFKHVRRVGHL